MKEQREKAVARNDEQNGDATRTAAATGLVAQKIISLAQKNGVPVREDRHLIEILSTIDPAEEIPAELYKAVAEILEFVHTMSTRL